MKTDLLRAAHRRYTARWRRKNRAACRVAANQWRKSNPARRRATRIKSDLKCLYDLSVQEWRDLLKRQRHRCAICRRKRKLCVDHDHETKRVRGALCLKCNLGLGSFEDSVVSLRRAMSYLRR